MATGRNADGEWVNPQEEIGIPREPQAEPSHRTEDEGTEDNCLACSGNHEIDMGAVPTIVPSHDKKSWVLDVYCKHCGRHGSLPITGDEEVNW